MKTNEAIKTALHFIPGDGPNGLIQAISLTTNLKVKILTLYTIDETVPKFCSENGIEIESLGFTEKNLLKQIFEFFKYLYKENQLSYLPTHFIRVSFAQLEDCFIGRQYLYR